MSVKRQATTDLNHENWDQEDPADHEEMGTFKTASKEILEKRVIRTAKRRTQITSSEEPKKSVFSGFGGFNKPPPTSFDFLANLTNGSKPANGTPAASSNLFSTQTTSSPSSGLFSASVSSPATKPSFSVTNSQSPVFGDSNKKFGEPASIPSSLFTPTSSQDSPFKLPTSSFSPSTGNTMTFAKSNSLSNEASNTINKSPFATSTISSPFKKLPTTNNATEKQLPSIPTTSAVNNNKTEEKGDKKKLKYYSKLKGLNECVSDWIKKHIEETPLCILTPIFKDYEKHLKEMQDEYHGNSEKSDDSNKISNNAGSSIMNKSLTSPFGKADKKTDLVFENKNSKQEKSPFSLGSQPSTVTASSTGFSFGINAATTATSSSPFSLGSQPSTVTAASTGFSFGINAATTATSSSPFSFASSTTTTTSPSKPFSFGTGKPFSFAPNTQVQPPPEPDQNNEDEEPPKVEFTPVVEENSVFEKKCKIFVKKDGNFVDKGVGTLYIKKIEESQKHQLLVRANTNLGTVLVNLVLASAIPTQRMGKNNVMLVCIPTSESKPPPTPILIRVKTSEEADELLETLNKYKM